MPLMREAKSMNDPNVCFRSIPVIQSKSANGDFEVGSCHSNPPCREAVGRGTVAVGDGGGAATARHWPLRQRFALPPPHGLRPQGEFHARNRSDAAISSQQIAVLQNRVALASCLCRLSPPISVASPLRPDRPQSEEGDGLTLSLGSFVAFRPPLRSRAAARL